MLNNKIFTKKLKNIFIITLIIVILLIISGFIMIKYDVMGETKLPFNLSKINIVSTGTGENFQKEDGNWYINVIQKNDIFFCIEKNEKYKKDAVIKTILFDNFTLIEENKVGEVKIYKPNEENDLYKYKEEYQVNSLEYNGAEKTDNKLLEINNQGGVIGFSIANSNLGEILIQKDQMIASDGTLLNLVNAKHENIKFTISFDMIIYIENGNTYKAKIKLNLPEEDITSEGVFSREESNLKNIVFKRI